MKSQIKSILIPTDFSELSETALKVGTSIAKRQNAEITLIHVVDRFAYLPPTEVFLPDIRPTPDIILTMEDRLREFSDQLMIDTGLSVTGKVFVGQPSERICRFAYEEKNSLIVMGTHGASGLREFFIGSEAYSVVKNAPCPVLTIPGNWEKTDFEKVLFPIRMIPNAIDKYFYARPIIEKNDSELFLLGLSEMKNHEDIKELTLIIDRLKMQLRNDNVKFQTGYCPFKDFPDIVINTAKEAGIDLLVLTANFENDLKTFFIGPFVQQVINRSRLPVLSIKPSFNQTEPVSTLKLAENWGKSSKFTRNGFQANK
jgi:nucleotide-binding universal stress UspA family protein